MRIIHRYENIIYQCVESGELEIDQQGRIWRLKKRGWDRWKQETVARTCNRVRAEHDCGPYLIIRALIDGKRMHTQAARLVYRHFKGEIPEGLTINHENGNKKDNLPRNLEPASYAQQAHHVIHTLKKNQHMLNQCGEKNHAAKLRGSDVIQIMERRRLGEPLRDIAKDFRISFQHVSKLARGERWTKTAS